MASPYGSTRWIYKSSHIIRRIHSRVSLAARGRYMKTKIGLVIRRTSHARRQKLSGKWSCRNSRLFCLYQTWWNGIRGVASPILHRITGKLNCRSRYTNPSNSIFHNRGLHMTSICYVVVLFLLLIFLLLFAYRRWGVSWWKLRLCNLGVSSTTSTWGTVVPLTPSFQDVP